MRSRTRARECVLKILYQSEIAKTAHEPSLNEYFQWNQEPEEVIAFAKRLITGIHEHLPELDGQIKKFAEHWDLSRMAVVDRNILRLGCFELLFSDDVPPKVSINEAIELGKKFGDVESAKFINGILDRIYKEKIAAAGLP